MSGALSGLRVIQLGQSLAPALAGMLLADNGANLLSVERPTEAGRFHASSGQTVWSRNKRPWLADLDSPEARDQLVSLVESCDILLCGLSPATATRLGVEWRRLQERNPQLILVTIAPYGSWTADAGRAGWDILVQARTGMMGEQDGHRPGPIFYQTPVPSYGAAFLAVTGALAALHARELGVGGQWVETSLKAGALMHFTMHWAKAETPTPPFARGLPKSGPFGRGPVIGVYRCGDGKYLHYMGSAGKNAFPKMIELFGMTPGRFASSSSPGAAAEIEAFLEQAFLTDSRDNWIRKIWGANLPSGPSLEPGEVFDDPQVAALEMAVFADHPELGPVRQIGLPLKFSKTPGVAPRYHPALKAPDWAEAAEKPGLAITTKKRGQGALAGIRVLDFGIALAGPFGPMLLADLGADVIKVEQTDGEMMRGTERVFAGCQRNKRGFAVDLKTDEGLDLVHRLVRTADVVHHNMRPGVAERIGIGYAQLQPIKPDLIYCHAPAYGSVGPYAGFGGFDQVYEAMCGHEVAGGGKGNPPMWYRTGFVDYANAIMSAIGVLMALRHRDRTGEGQYVESAQLSAGMLMKSETHFVNGERRGYLEVDHDQTGYSPFYRIYRASDAWLAIVCSAEKRAALAAALKLPESGLDANAIAEQIAAEAASEICQRLDAAGVPCEVVQEDMEERFLADLGNLEEGWATDYPVNHPVWGTMRQVGTLIRLEKTPMGMERPCPLIGQHTPELLRDLGCTDEEQQRLRYEGIVAWPDA